MISCQNEIIMGCLPVNFVGNGACVLEIRPLDWNGEKNDTSKYRKINTFHSFEYQEKKHNKNEKPVKTNTYKSKTGVTSIQITGP